ncbi:MAG: hypothetical protein J7J98_01170 [candidate division Zixibacteria bacterium]|nr:hypothetical protein [candidate division Zixibacteria bacterium]
MSAFILNRLKKRIKDRRATVRPALPGIGSALSRPFIRLLSQEKSTPTLFCELVNKLGKWFSISKAALAIYCDQTGMLKLSSWWDMNSFKEGVLMSLPAENSLFYQALQSNRIIHEQVNGHFSGNFVEQRLMSSRSTSALVVCPLLYRGVKQGVISLASPVPFAFEMLEEGYFSRVLEKIAFILAARSSDEFWGPVIKADGQNTDPIGQPDNPSLISEIKPDDFENRLESKQNADNNSLLKLA